MCGSVVDIQSGTAEIRRGKKKEEEEEEEEEETGQKYNVRRAAKEMQCDTKTCLSM